MNALNDEFCTQLIHQGLFSFTEFFSTCIALYCCDTRHTVTFEHLACIMTISIAHIVTSGLDQFVSNVFLSQGEAHQIGRDVGFIICDICFILLPVLMLCQKNSNIQRVASIHDCIVYSTVFIVGFVAFTRIV